MSLKGEGRKWDLVSLIRGSVDDIWVWTKWAALGP